MTPLTDTVRMLMSAAVKAELLSKDEAFDVIMAVETYPATLKLRQAFSDMRDITDALATIKTKQILIYKDFDELLRTMKEAAKHVE